MSYAGRQFGRSGRAAIAANPAPAPHPAYWGMYLGAPSGSIVLDVSGREHHGARQANLTEGELWVAAPAFSTQTQDSAGVTFGSSGDMDWDMSLGDSLLVSLQLTIGTNAGATQQIAGSSYTATNRGWTLRQQGTAPGRCGLAVSDASGTTASATGSIVIGDSAPHWIQFAINGQTKLGSLWVDGVLDSTIQTVDYSARTASTTGAHVMSIGNANARTGAFCYAGIWQFLHVLVFKNGATLPADLAGALARLRSYPHMPLAATWT